MSKLTSPLDHLRIAAPCPADWDQMFSFEDERVRFCSQCNLNVYNLSGMSVRLRQANLPKPHHKTNRDGEAAKLEMRDVEIRAKAAAENQD